MSPGFLLPNLSNKVFVLTSNQSLLNEAVQLLLCVTLSLKYSANIQNGNDREQFSRND
ncbi:hypothetical protein SAMN03080617_03794 [Algoriphagus alkaliphilus]|uniref:Uncharacterized protein n=1 Tax=Algoriphagus alkaliphilus TaxID=279824 RepID=A0A1G5ZG26_9BACT|nr:hypothetical protein SAMN03080617_03794 [Algoriphagus alkaliphilus]